MDRDAAIVKLLKAEAAGYVHDVIYARLSLRIQAHELSLLLCHVLAVNSKLAMLLRLMH